MIQRRLNPPRRKMAVRKAKKEKKRLMNWKHFWLETANRCWCHPQWQFLVEEVMSLCDSKDVAAEIWKEDETAKGSERSGEIAI